MGTDGSSDLWKRFQLNENVGGILSDGEGCVGFAESPETLRFPGGETMAPGEPMP